MSAKMTTRWIRRGARSLLLAAALLLPNLAPECNETEPNGTPDAANFIKPGETGSGAISPVGDADYWRASGVSAGDVVFAMVHSGNAEDAILHVVANDKASTFAVDDDSGPDADPAIAGSFVPQSGDIYFQINESFNIDQIPAYSLFQAVLRPSDTAAEVEPNGTSATANPIRAGMTSGSVVAGSGDADFFKFSAAANATVVVIVDEDPDDLTDTVLTIVDTDGTTPLASGDNDPLNESNAAGPVTVANAGTYYVKIENGGGGQDDEYRFVLLVNGVVYRDAEGDGVPQPDDNCPGNTNPGQNDADGDGVGDACDLCPASILKRSAGACGCDQPDVDINNDGIVDCNLADPARSMLTRNGLLLVPDQNNHRVLAFDPTTGDLIDANFIPTDATHLNTPIAAILGPDKSSILVSDASLNVIQKFDLDGQFVETFAPAGGADTSILQEPAGLTLAHDGSVLVCVDSGANADAVARFDDTGHLVSNFIANGAGGLVDPSDIVLRLDGSVLVTSTSGATKQYDSTGAFTGDFATPSDDPRQIIEKQNHHVAIAFAKTEQRGIVEYQSNGVFIAQLSPAALSDFEGVAELSAGHFLVATGSRVITGGNGGLSDQGGVFELDAAGNVLLNKIIGGRYSFIEFALIDTDGDGIGDDLDGCPNDPAKQSAGACGCGQSDADTNGNGIADCNDPPPVVDECPDDPDKLTPGECGCGVADTDSDGNGIADCNDTATPSPDSGSCGACGAGTATMLPLMLLGLCTLTRRKIGARRLRLR